jgi:hypothetical protein
LSCLDKPVGRGEKVLVSVAIEATKMRIFPCKQVGPDKNANFRPNNKTQDKTIECNTRQQKTAQENTNIAFGAIIATSVVMQSTAGNS